ncbi:MAG: hypothetical protein A2W62_01360 [Alphaproteobacteria bacterium RIFCSPLOWO2_02_42_7]|nr:MAG: hypothetical protein A2W62_01360 [Alphaproteobacteria bacterium RIFCSPLOWO2_02_42_7]
MINKALFLSCSLLVTFLLLTPSVMAMEGDEGYYGAGGPILPAGSKRARANYGEGAGASSSASAEAGAIRPAAEEGNLNSGLPNRPNKRWRETLADPAEAGASSSASAGGAGANATLANVPNEIIQKNIFMFCDMWTLGRLATSCRNFKSLLTEDLFWKAYGLERYGVYLSEENLRVNPREKVIQHFLKVRVHMMDDSHLLALQDIGNFVFKYRLFDAPSLKDFIFCEALLHHHLESRIRGFALYALPHQLLECWDKDNDDPIPNKRKPLLREAIEILIRRGDQDAIGRKIYALGSGSFYTRDQGQARAMNEYFVRKGDRDAINRKIAWLLWGEEGYTKDLAEARKMNDTLVEKGDRHAIRRKIDGLANGTDGYERDLEAARALNDSLANAGDRDAIRRKLDGLANGADGYERDLEAAQAVNDSLANAGDRDAIRRKIDGLVNGTYGYEKNLVAARALNDSLANAGDQMAIERKIYGLENGRYGYYQDLEALMDFIESRTEKGDSVAIGAKMRGLFWGYYGYEEQEDTSSFRPFIEKLIESDHRTNHAIGYFLKAYGLKYGMFGYYQNRDAARRYILEHHVPFL